MIDNIKKIFFLLSEKERKNLLILTLLLFFGMILEVFGLGILIPLISLLLDPESLSNNSFLIILRPLFSEFSDQNFYIIFILLIISLLITKIFFLLFLTFKQNIFLSNLTASLSKNLFQSYLSQPYNFHLERNAAELIKNIQIEIGVFSSYLLSLVTILIEGGILISVILTLIYIEPIGAISIGLFFGLFSSIFFQFTKRKLLIWGNLRQEIDIQLSKISLEGIGSVKDLLILGRTDFFINAFSSNSQKKARITANNGTVSQMPRYFLELITILGLMGFIVIMLYRDENKISLISTLGVFVAATFRMIPSLTRILASFQNFKFNHPSVEIIYNEIKSAKKINSSPKFDTNFFDFKSKIELKNIFFNYSEDKLILKNINLTIHKGDSIGIIGESGSGKSTLIDMILGLHIPSKGEFKIDGIDSLKVLSKWRKSIGYVSQSIYLTDDSIKNNIALGIPDKEINYKKINDVIDQVQLRTFINLTKDGINSKVGERGMQLSGGQLQRIGIARALYNDPKVLVLDEATSSLDQQTETEVLESINNFKDQKTVIMIAHRLSTLRNCDYIYKIEDGKISKTEILN